MKLSLLSIFALVAGVVCAAVSGCQSTEARAEIYSEALENFEDLRLSADLEKPAIKKVAPYLKLTDAHRKRKWKPKFENGQYKFSYEEPRVERFALDVSRNAENDGAMSISATITDNKTGEVVVNFSRAASDVSPKEFAAQIRAELFRSLRGITVPALAESDRVIGINRGNAFGIAFFAQMEKRGWRCVSIGRQNEDYGDARFVAVFSGSRASSDFAREVTGTLIDLKSGRAVLKITRHQISAYDFAEFFSNIIIDPNQN